MRASLLFGSCGGGLAALLGEPDLSAYTYDDYRKAFPRALQAGEEDGRQSVFEANVAWIKSHNAEADKLWFADVNQFTDMTNKEYAAHIKGRARGGALFAGKAEPFEFSISELPERVDWREQDGIVTPAKDQGSCGSCWAFSAASTFESHLALATGEPAEKLSPQQIVDCAPNPQHCGGKGGCDGSTQPLAFDYTKTAGLTTEAKYSYQAATGTCSTSKIEPVGFNKGHVELPQNNYTALVSAVATKGPIAVSIAAGGLKFQFYGGGIMEGCSDYVMDHAVQMVGYGSDKDKHGKTVDYWLVRNSWGGSWGEEGYFRLQRHGEGKEPCGMDNKPQDGDACDGDTTPKKLCGECAILSSSSYPTGMTKAALGPSAVV